MYVFQYIRSYNRMKIRVHEIENKVYISVILSSDYVLKSNDIFVAIELLQKHHFSEGALSIGGIIECIIDLD